MKSSAARRLPRALGCFAAGLIVLVAAVFATKIIHPQPWWKRAVIYEIYPRAFQDSNGGGDLNGITARLDYLQALGADAIWLAPTYPSPQVDFGADISDYRAVDPRYGSMADMNRLFAAARRRHIRVVLDMVLGHTSDEHPWFITAASARSDPKHDWYIWSDGVPGEGAQSHEGRLPPNDEASAFGGSAWEWVAAVHQYYHHKFYRQEPDLNWRDPAVEQAMFAAMRFWLDRGVGGFHLDAAPNQPEAHQMMRRLRAMVDRYPGQRILIGETDTPNIGDLDAWYGGAQHDELHLATDMLFGFHGDHDRLDAATFRRHIQEAQTDLHGSQPLFAFDNPDTVRVIERYGDGVHDARINRLLASLLLTPRATALVYYGQEIGLRTTPPTRDETVKGRDDAHTPMPWSVDPQAGPDAKTTSVAAQAADPTSTLNWYKELIDLRRHCAALREGRLIMLDNANPHVLSFVREAGMGQSVLVTLNLTAEPQRLDLAKVGLRDHKLTTLLTDAPSLQSINSADKPTLPPFATWIAGVK